MRENPKSEIRNPNKIRSPKETRSSRSKGVPLDAEFETWGGVTPREPMALRDAPAEGQRHAYDLEARTAQFGEAIIRFAKTIPRNPVNNRLIDQLVGAGTSIGANFSEADNAVSGKDFKLRIGTCRKESKETMFFLRMIAAAEEGLASEARELWREAKQLNLIFGAIWRK
jgi:four helix bundle protein